MGRVDRELSRLSRENRDVAELLIEKVCSRKTAGFNVMKLKGSVDIFRIKQGRVRAIYTMEDNGRASIKSVGLRNESTYKF